MHIWDAQEWRVVIDCENEQEPQLPSNLSQKKEFLCPGAYATYDGDGMDIVYPV